MIPNAHKSQNTECPVGYSVYLFFFIKYWFICEKYFIF